MLQELSDDAPQVSGERGGDRPAVQVQGIRPSGPTAVVPVRWYGEYIRLFSEFQFLHDSLGKRLPQLLDTQYVLVDQTLRSL